MMMIITTETRNAPDENKGPTTCDYYYDCVVVLVVACRRRHKWTGVVCFVVVVIAGALLHTNNDVFLLRSVRSKQATTNDSDNNNNKSTSTAMATTAGHGNKNDERVQVTADPQALRSGVEAFLRQRRLVGGLPNSSTIDNRHINSDTAAMPTNDEDAAAFWAVFEQYHNYHTHHHNWNSSNDNDTTTRHHYQPHNNNVAGSEQLVCHVGPGQGLEEAGGFKLLTEKVRLQHRPHPYDNPTTTTNNKNNSKSSNVTILCAMYTHAPMQDLARAAALTWGYQCDGFLAFSSSSNSSKQSPQEAAHAALGVVTHVSHNGPESYGNMWQKVRSLWAYLADRMLHDNDEYNKYKKYDFVHLCGDDTYVLVSNLKQLLHEMAMRLGPNEPVHLGQWIPRQRQSPNQNLPPYIAGGPGYTINRAALRLFANQALHTCHVDTVASFEDRLFSKCLQGLGVWPGDTRDPLTGEQRYHDATPHHLYTTMTSPTTTTATSAKWSSRSFHARAAAYWESLPFPAGQSSHTWQPQSSRNETTTTRVVGPKHHLESAAMYSIAFHNIYSPLYMARIHAILNPSLCALGSPLREGMRYLASKRKKGTR